jgi:hypothetical protein
MTMLACEVSKQKIIILKVKLVWNGSVDPTVTVSHFDVVPFEDDRRSMTALEWIEPEGGQVGLRDDCSFAAYLRCVADPCAL